MTDGSAPAPEPDYRLLFESSPAMYLVFRPDLTIVAASDALLKASMAKRADIVGRKVSDVFPDNPDDPTASGVGHLRSSVERVLRHGVADSLALQKYDIPSPDNPGEFQERYWSPTNIPVFGADGQIVYIINWTDDVTEFVRAKQRQAEEGQTAEELRNPTTKMEAEIVQRTEEQQEVMRRVDAANQMKSAFLANMSHELRTPLNAILGFSGLLQEQLGASLTERQRRYLDNIQVAGQHLLELINDVLDLSKVEAGKLSLRPEIITLDALLEPVIAAAGASTQAKGIALDIDVPSGIELNLDPTRVRQVVLNLVSNAVKFTPAGRVRLAARVEDGALLIDISDTGIGIPSDAHERVFGAFDRLHEGRFEAQGTGLGLALTKRLVELQGGTVTFESAEHQGTTFHVRLPGVGPAPVAGPRILIVEDVRSDAELIVAVAASSGLSAEVVHTLSDAAEALRRAAPLGVVLDLELPDGRGEELLRSLKRTPGMTTIPILVATATDSEPDDLLALGADDYLTKPIDRVRLQQWLARIVRRTIADPRSGPNPA